MTNQISIYGISITQDAQGRFRLNDFHKASGGEKRHQPSNWEQSQQTKELISEIKSSPGIPGVEQNQPLITINGGSNPGTYVCKQLVYSYAMWVSAKFSLEVINTFDAVVNKTTPIPQSFAEALQLAAHQQFEIQKLEAKAKLDQPKVEFFDTVTSENPKLSIGDYAKLLSEANDIVIGPNKLMDFLRSAGYLMSGRDIKEKNKPYQRYVEMGYFIVEYVPTNVGMMVQPLITLFGQAALANQIIAHFSKK